MRIRHLAHGSCFMAVSWRLKNGMAMALHADRQSRAVWRGVATPHGSGLPLRRSGHAVPHGAASPFWSFRSRQNGETSRRFRNQKSFNALATRPILGVFSGGRRTVQNDAILKWVLQKEMFTIQDAPMPHSTPLLQTIHIQAKDFHEAHDCQKEIINKDALPPGAQ